MIDEIHLSLEEILSIKQDLREVANIPNTIPFSAYYSYMAWQEDLDSIPLSPKYLDFTKNRYSESGVPCGINSVGNFTRLTSATMWQDGQLVEVQNNIPRISGEGLLIESQATNAIRDNTFTSATVNNPNDVSLSDVVDSSIPDAKLLTSKVEWSSRSGALTNLQAQWDYVLGSNVLLQDGYHRSYIVKNSGGARYASLISSDMTAFGAVIDFAEEVYVGESAGSVRNLGGGWWELRLWHDFNTNISNKRFRVAFGNTLNGTNLITEIGDNVFVAYPSAYDAKNIDLSIIPTYGTTVTRSPDILIIDVEPNQYISGEWDDGVVFEQFSGYAKFSGHGYIRNIEVLDLQGRPAQ